MKLTTVQPHRGTIHTPLRYPGGKTRLYGLLRRLIEESGLESPTYVEPYAGGAGAALSLLINRNVDRIVINDLDPAIHAFWKAVTSEPEDFVRLLNDVPLTLHEWERQRTIYRRAEKNDALSLGFATFFLNRTNRSGVMNAGVIGGKAQSGKYKIDARFNRAVLTNRILAIAERATDIVISNMDGKLLLENMLPNPLTFFYIDPPYFDKGSFLYLNAFDSQQHVSLSQVLSDHLQSHWVLTYDDVPAIRQLYRGMYQGTFELPYSAHASSKAKERMIASSRVALETSLFERSI